jgi:glucokinase
MTTPFPIVLGIDIGGTKIAAAAVTPQGEIVSRATMPTQAERGFPDGLRRIEALLDEILAAAPEQVAPAGIGIGCPGPLDPLRGTIDNPYTLPTWDGVNIVAPLRARWGVPVRLENDADAAAMGEVWLGAGRGGRTVVMITVGTGIGGALIVDGRIYRGVAGAHPEIGHLRIDAAGPECYCGLRGCWEAVAAGPAIEADARAHMPDRPPASVTAPAVVAWARAGDPAARAVVDRAAQATAVGVFVVLNLYMPDVVVLGGGVMEAYDLFEPAILDLVARNTMAPVERIAVRKAALGNDAGILGAARIAWDVVGT